MELKSGYKQTELGVLPQDWRIEALGNKALKVGSGLTPTGGNRVYKQHGRPFLRSQNVGWGSLLLGDLAYIDDATHLTFADTEIRVDDVFLNITGASIGRSAVADVRLEGGNVNQHVCIIRTEKAELLPRFLNYFLLYDAGQRQIDSFQAGGNRQGLNFGQVRSIRVPLPSEAEQHAIADALSDVDALLGGLDRLIAKKRDLKQAATQQLLTGQTRLPGFSGEWEVKRLGDHVTFLRNGVNSRAELQSEGRVKYLHYGDVHACKDVYRSPKGLPSLPESKAASLDRLRDGDLVIADASEDVAGVTKSVEISGVGDSKLVPGLHTIAARFDKKVLADGFKGFLQFCPSFASHLRRLAAGTKVYATNRAHIAGVEMRLPTVFEQTAIATVLSDMDAEIAALEQRRDKTRALKQAMMQELLTGRTRLVKPASGIASEAGQVVEFLSTKHKTRNKHFQDAPQANVRRGANVHFMRTVLAAEIVDRLHEEPTFGHVKFEKLIFLAERLCKIDTGSTYHRDAAGPYDNRALRSIDSQLRKLKWFNARKAGSRYQYVPMKNRGGHEEYFERYFHAARASFDRIIGTFRTVDTERCEIVATLFAAWDDLMRQHRRVSDEAILHEVLNNWHESKRRIPEDRWHKALGWMKRKGFVPSGFKK